jgi:hypothetical protein
MARSRVRESVAEIARQIEAAVREQADDEIELAVDEQAHAMKTYAESISPVHTGHYADSFEIDKGTRDGLPTRTLKNTDDIANLVEYGSVHNAEHAVLGRTAEAFGGEHHQGE